MEGIDVSEKDDYVRTFDIVSYTIEVNIDKNSNANIGEDEILKGGVIKVKATKNTKSFIKIEAVTLPKARETTEDIKISISGTLKTLATPNNT